MDERKRELTSTMLWLCIDQWNEATVAGQIFSIMRSKPMAFHDFDQMVLCADTLFDETGYPQSFQKKRIFQRNQPKKPDNIVNKPLREPVRSTASILQHHGAFVTLILMVNSRQHTSWQGTVLNEEFHMVAEFHDVVDIMNIISEIFIHSVK